MGRWKDRGIGRRATLVSGTTEEWREMWEVNVLALSICTRAREAIRDMRERGNDGHVMDMWSLGAHRQTPAGSGNGMYIDRYEERDSCPY